MSPTSIPITNKQLRRQGWGSFVLSASMAVAGGFDFFDPSDTVILGFLAHAALCFGLPTVRNIFEGHYASRPYQEMSYELDPRVEAV